MTSLLLVNLALAAPITDAPLVADVTLPPTGVAAISIPVEMRSRDEAAEDYVLLDANDREVPFVWVVSEERRSIDTTVTPTLDRDTYTVTVDEPVDGLTVDLPPGARATVLVSRRDGEALMSRFVWNLPQGRSGNVPLPALASGPLSLRFVWVGDAASSPPDVHAWVQDLRLDNETVPLAVGAPVADATGTTWWQVSSPRAVPAADTELRVDLDAATFDRFARVREGNADGVELGQGQVFRSGAGAQLGVPLNLPERQMAIGFDPTRDPMPTLKSAALSFKETRMFVRDAGPGPHRLYGGRHRAIGTRNFDLEVDRNLLLRARPTPIAPAAPAPNAAYVAPEIAANLIAPGQELTLPKWRWKQPIQGQGLVELAVPLDVMAKAREDLSDVRVIDAAGLELPRTVANLPSRLTWTVVPPKRTEDGSRSILEIPLPHADVPVTGVRLRTAATVFSRDVQIERVGLGNNVVSAAWWNGDPAGSTLDLPIGQRVGDTLRIVIENGSDAPLPVDEVAVSTPNASLITFVPAGGATLVYGNPLAVDPAFDLMALNEELRDRGPAPATLGPAVAIERPPLPLWDRLLLLAGLAVASVALLGVTIRAALSAPEPTPG